MYVHIRLLKRRLNSLERIVPIPLDYCCPACPKVWLLKCIVFPLCSAVYMYKNSSNVRAIMYMLFC